MRLSTNALLVVVLGATACATGAAGWTRHGYRNETYAYRVDFASGEQRFDLPKDWVLDNFTRESSGLVEKREGSYSGVRKQDLNGDGIVGADEVHQDTLFDLKFVHSRNGGVIWLKAHPVSLSDVKLDLKVLLDDYVDSLGGRGLYAQGSVFSTERARTREFMPFVRDAFAMRVDGVRSITGQLELAEVERLRTDPTHRSLRIEVVMTKFSRPGGGVGLLVAGYAMAPAEFDKSVADFRKLISAVHLPPTAPQWEVGLPPGDWSTRGAASASPPASSAPPAPPPPAPAPTASAPPAASSSAPKGK